MVVGTEVRRGGEHGGISEYSISTVIPVRNGAAFIERALDSVLTQTRRPEEIIVVDDGSTDGTAARVREYGRGVRLICTAPRGVAAARNAGVEASASDFIAFLDADDYWVADYLERMRRTIDATDGSAALYFSDMQVADARGGGTLWARCGFEIPGDWALRDRDKSWLFQSWQPILIQASVVSRRHYLEVGGCDPMLTRRSDTHVIFKVGLRGPLCAVAGEAGEWTASNEGSLTETYTPTHPVYAACTVALYEDLVRTLDLAEEETKLLRSRAAAASVQLARLAGVRHPARFVKHVAAAVSMSPRATLSAGARKFLPL